jgi:hypothetical protein
MREYARATAFRKFQWLVTHMTDFSISSSMSKNDISSNYKDPHGVKCFI